MKAIFFSIIFLTAVLNTQVFAAGPWKGKVIDAETKEPIEKVAVVESSTPENVKYEEIKYDFSIFCAIFFSAGWI